MDDFYETYLSDTKRTIGNSTPSGNAGVGDANMVIKQQLTQIKLLTNDNQIKEQQVEILKDKVRESEELNAIYKKQIENLEQKLKLYDQELTTKIQASHEKSQKYHHQNIALARRNEELQNAVMVSDKKRQIAEEQLFQVSREIQEVRNHNQEIQENLEKLKVKLRKREAESKAMKQANEQLVREIEEAHRHISNINAEKERMMHLSEDYDRQIRQFNGLEKAFHDLQHQQEIERSEANLTRQNLEQLKKKYDELFYDYNLLVLNKRNEEEQEYFKKTIQELENALHESRETRRVKEQEIEGLKETVLDAEARFKEQEIVFDNDLKKALGLLDGKTVDQPKDIEQVRSKTLQALLGDILEFNKEYLKLENRVEELTNELNTQREKYSRAQEELEEVEASLEAQKKQNETFLVKLNTALNESQMKTTESQMHFDQQIESILKETRQNEERLRAVITEKEEENERLRDVIAEQLNSLTSVEAEKEKAYEFLRQQEREVKEFKQHFKQIAEETTICKSRVNLCVYLIGDLLKLFFNLHSKYDCLAYQKSVLAPILQNYFKIRSQFVFERKGQSPNRQRKYHIYVHFRRIVSVVIAANRLKNLGLRNINVKPLDLNTIKKTVTGLREDQFAFYGSLYKLNTFAIDKNFLNRIFDSVCRNFVDDEYGLLFDMLSIGVQLRKFNFEKASGEVGIGLKADGLNTVTAALKLVEESRMIMDKSAYQEKEICRLENMVLDMQAKTSEDIDQITLQLRDTLEENEQLIRDKEAVSEEYEIARSQVEALLNVLKERKSVNDSKEGERRENTDLVQQLNILAKCIDDLHSENEVKNLKILQLQKKLLTANESISNEDDSRSERKTRLLENSDQENKMPTSTFYRESKGFEGRTSDRPY